MRTFCPVCEGEDSNSPSMAIKRARDGEALLYCFSGRGGCGLDRKGGRDWDDVERAFEAFAGEVPPRQAGAKWRRRTGDGARPEDMGATVAATYDYGDGFKKIRYEWPDGWRKDFRWRPRKPGERLYLPPTEDDKARWVFLCEGEKDVDRLRSLGLCATTPSEGHLTKRLAKRLAGHNVAALMDYDAHGERAREAAAELLDGVAARFVRVDLPGFEVVPSGGQDVSDWLDLGHGREDLQAAVLASLPDPPPRATEAPVETAPAGGTYPAMDEAAQSGPPEGPVCAGWKNEAGWLQQLDGTKWKKRAQLTVKAHEVLTDEDGIVRAFDVEFFGVGPVPVRCRVLERFLGSSSRPDALLQMGGPATTPQESQAVAELLASVRSSAVQSRTVLTRAEWRGDELWVPGAVEVAPQREELDAYGHRSDIPEDAARGAWQEVIELARGAGGKSMAVLGMPIGSLYVTKLDDPQIFTLHVTGESHSGKSESAELAFSTLSEARRGTGRAYRNWNMSDKAPGNVLKQVGVMPVWFDEAANDEREPESFSHMLFNLMDGRERRIAGTDGRNVAGGATWTACVLSTGEARLTIKSGLTGFRRRVMEVYAPLTDRETHERMMHLARSAHGWPLAWTAADPDPDRFVALHRSLFYSCADLAQGQQVEVAQAANVATCVAGFAQLARTAGVDVPAYELQQAAQSVFRKLLRAAEDEGADVGERGLRALKEAVQTTANFHEPAVDMFIQRWGVVYDDGYVGVLGEATLSRILREYAGIGDAQPVLEKWSETGILKRDAGRYTSARRCWNSSAREMRRARMFLVKVR